MLVYPSIPSSSVDSTHFSMKLPPIVTLPQPDSSSDHSDEEQVNHAADTAIPLLDHAISPATLGKSVLPGKFGPAGTKRKALENLEAPRAKTLRTAAKALVARRQPVVPPSLPLSDSEGSLPDIYNTLPSNSLPATRMSTGGGGSSSSLRRPNVQSASSAARAVSELIVIDSSDEDEPKPSTMAKNSTPRPSEIIVLDSDSDSASESPKRVFPLLAARKSLPAASGSSRPTSQPHPRPRPRPHPHPVLSKSAPAIVEQALPPLPSSSDAESEIKLNSGPAIASSLARSTTTSSVLAHRAAPKNEPSSDADSRSSDEILETELIVEGPDEPSVVLGSDGSSGSDGGPVPAVLDSDRLNPPPDRGRTADAASPRNRASSRSSPSHASGSHSDTEARTEPELEDSIANVSLYDPQPGPPDVAVAQTVQAVEGIDLNDESRSMSTSSGETSRNECSAPGCSAKFSSAGQLRTHMSRDHGIRLSSEAKQLNKGKRKANTSLPTSTRKRIAAIGSEGQTTRVSVPRGSSIGSPAGSETSQRYVERSNTVGFDSFAQNLPDREASSSPEPYDHPDVIVVPDSSPSPPRTPQPQAPKMRAPHPNIRPAVPDSPSVHLSPSKQLAQRKDAVLIEGEELVTWRVDLVNSMPESYRNRIGCRAVFEAFIEDAMRHNEPCAPEITVENEVDSQPCPPWEFVYYNRMVYGTNVPRPDPNVLEGCDCLGPCDPENKDCACVRRQEKYFEDNPGLSDFSGFAFKVDGTIKYHNGAVFGCNSKCSCDLECQNKVLQQGRKHAITIKKTKTKGWGVFAKETIPAGSYIGVYTGELLTEGFAGKRARVYDEFGRTYLLNIDFAHIRSNKDAPTYAVDAFHAGNFTRFFNHSCRPNMFLTAYYCEDADIQKPLITLFCDRVIKPGQELTFSYTGLDADDPEDVAKVQKIKLKEKLGRKHKGKVFGECLCGAEGCFGIMFS